MVVLKKCCPEISSVLSRLFNFCLTESIFPSSWKLAHVVPVFKDAGDKCRPSNYRPISLISVVGKVFECLLNQSLLEYLEFNNLLSDAQYGFRHARSTGDLLSFRTGHLSFVFKKRGEAFVVALDISKAFDRIWHKGLLHKLKSYGITGPYHAIISDFLNNRQIKVVLDGQSSSVFLINSGVPQGFILGPTLFLLLINDLPDALQSQVALYADDTNIFCPSLGRWDASRTELCSMLDRDLAQVLAWSQDCIVTFNDRKSKLISVSRSKDRNFPAIHIGPQVLAYSEDLSILGMDISSDLSWGKYVSDMRVGCLSRARKFIPPSALLYLYKTSIRPLIEYCSHIWAGAPDCYLRMFDKVQRRLCYLGLGCVS